MTTFSRRSPGAGLVAAVVLVGGLLAGLAAPMRCDAQAVEPREALEDAKLYFTAPLRWDARDWLEFGGTLVALGVVHEFDDDVRDHFVGNSAGGLDSDDPNSAEDALPAAVLLAGTWLLAGVTDEPAGWRELGSMLEASAFTAVSTEVLKFSLGRQRPNETTDPDGWFDGGDSFPSMHTSLAFAIGTVLAESGDDRHRWLRRILGYGLPALRPMPGWTTISIGRPTSRPVQRWVLRRRASRSTGARAAQNARRLRSGQPRVAV